MEIEGTRLLSSSAKGSDFPTGTPRLISWRRLCFTKEVDVLVDVDAYILWDLSSLIIYSGSKRDGIKGDYWFPQAPFFLEAKII